MAERKRRPPSGNIKPGTPHPTKAYTVRGFDGRWISRKAYNAAKKAREVAKKGGSLVKRASSAVTKASQGAMTKASKAGELLKIRKGDKGIVRAVKDTYQFGKDTRRSADAVYKAGKVTRKVHDQLVKGGKEFVKGTREAGKATRRVVERLKPGGKLVKTKGSKLTKYRKPNSKIVRSPKGEIVRSPKGEIVRSPKGELTKSTTNKGGKLTTTRTPQYKTDAKKTAKKNAAQQQSNARKKTRWENAQTKQQRAASGNFNVKEEWNPKTKKWETKYGSGTTKPRQSTPFKRAKEFVKTKGTKTVKKFVQKVKGVASKVNKMKGVGTLKKGLKIGGKYADKALKPLAALDLVGDAAGYVRQGGNIYRRIKGKPLLEFDNWLGIGKAPSYLRIKEKNEYLKKHGSLKGFTKSLRKPKSKPTATKQNNKGLTFKNMKEKGLLDKAQPIGTYKGEAKAEPIGTAKPGGAKAEPIGTAKPGGAKAEPLNKKKKTTTSKTPYWQSPRQKQEPKKKAAPKKKKLTMRDRMRAKNVEIHGDAANKVYDYNKRWQEARKAGKLKEFKKKNKARRHWQVGRSNAS